MKVTTVSGDVALAVSNRGAVCTAESRRPYLKVEPHVTLVSPDTENNGPGLYSNTYLCLAPHHHLLSLAAAEGREV